MRSLGSQSKWCCEEVNNLAVEIKENHSKVPNYSDPQYRLWARMIANGLHSSKDAPEVPTITGKPQQTYEKIPIEYSCEYSFSCC